VRTSSGANTFALAYASKSVTATRSELGLRSDKSFVVGDAILTPGGRAGWAHDFNPDRNIAATFQTLPGAFACRKSNTHIKMMKSAKKWHRQNATNGVLFAASGRPC